MHTHSLAAKAANDGYAGTSNCEKTSNNITFTKIIFVSLKESKKK